MRTQDKEDNEHLISEIEHKLHKTKDAMFERDQLRAELAAVKRERDDLSLHEHGRRNEVAAALEHYTEERRSLATALQGAHAEVGGQGQGSLTQ